MTPVSRATAAGRAYLDLQNRARREGRGTQEYLTAYVIERWLARLSRSPYASQFVLKGGVLLAAFGQRRPTVDADALAIGLTNDAEAVTARVAEIAAVQDTEDGVEFLAATVSARPIRDHELYHGIRVMMDARLATATIKLRLDINFGDPVIPAPQQVSLPGLRPASAPIEVLGYPVETVLAEKITTAIDLAEANTRRPRRCDHGRDSVCRSRDRGRRCSERDVGSRHEVLDDTPLRESTAWPRLDARRDSVKSHDSY